MEDSVVACRWCTHLNPSHLEKCEKCNGLLPASCPLGTFSAAPAKSKTQKTNARKRKKKVKKAENQRNKERKGRNKHKGLSASTPSSNSSNYDIDGERSSGDAGVLRDISNTPAGSEVVKKIPVPSSNLLLDEGYGLDKSKSNKQTVNEQNLICCKVPLNDQIMNGQITSNLLRAIENECHVSISIVNNNTAIIFGEQESVDVASGILFDNDNKVQQTIGEEVQELVVGDENSEEFKHIRRVLNMSESTSPLSSSQISSALVRNNNDVERALDELLPLETSEEVNTYNEEGLIKAAKCASLLELSAIESQQMGSSVDSDDNSLPPYIPTEYDPLSLDESQKDAALAERVSRIEAWRTHNAHLLPPDTTQQVSDISFNEEEIYDGIVQRNAAILRELLDDCNSHAHAIDVLRERIISEYKPGYLEDLHDLALDGIANSMIDRVLMEVDREGDWYLSDATAVFKETLELEEFDCSFKDAWETGKSFLIEHRHCSEKLAVSIMKKVARHFLVHSEFDDTCTPPAPLAPNTLNGKNVPREKTLEDEDVLDEQVFGYDDDQVTMDNLFSDTVDRHSLVTEYVSDNANKKRSSTGNDGAFYTLNGGLISRLKSMGKLSASSVSKIKAEGISKLSRVRDEVILKHFPLTELETRQIDTAVNYYTTATTNAEANGLAALLFNMLCPTPFSKGGRSSAFGGTANDTATFGRCDTIAAQLTLIEVLRSQGRIQLVNSSHLMPVACENSRIDCPLTKEVLEEFKKKLKRWTCPCTTQREADIITPISDVYLETLTRLRIPTVAIDGGGRSKSTELMMKGRNPDNIALTINNLGHFQFLNRLDDTATLDDLQVINDAFVVLGQALGMPESADTIFDEFCALTLQSPPFAGQNYKSSVIGFASRHVQQYGDEKIFSPKKLVVPSFFDQYARNNIQACINKFDDVKSSADIRLWHLQRLMSSRGAKKTSLMFEAMNKFAAMPSNEVDLMEVEATAKLLDMKANDLLQNINALFPVGLLRNNTREQRDLRRNTLSQFKAGIDIERTSINKILVHLRSVSDTVLSANNSIRPTSIRFVNRQSESGLAGFISFNKDTKGLPQIYMALELEPPQSKNIARPILGAIFDLLSGSEQASNRFNHKEISTTNSKNERVIRVSLAYIIMERVLVGNRLEPLPPLLKWWQCPRSDCTKFCLKDLGIDRVASNDSSVMICCVRSTKGGCGKPSVLTSTKESTSTWMKSDNREI